MNEYDGNITYVTGERIMVAWGPDDPIDAGVQCAAFFLSTFWLLEF